MAFPNTPILDSFTRPDEWLFDSPNWSTVGDGMCFGDSEIYIVGNQVAYTGLDTGGAYWLPSISLTAEAYFTVSALPAVGSSLWVLLNLQEAGGLKKFQAAEFIYFDEAPCQVAIWNVDDLCAPVMVHGPIDVSFGIGSQLGCSTCDGTFKVYIDGVEMDSFAQLQTGTQIGFYLESTSAAIVDFGGGECCVPLSSATITPAAGNNNAICQDQTFTASYLPLNASVPVAYLWSTDGLQSGQGTPTAVYQWTVTCSKTVTVTISNVCSSVSDSETFSVVFTLMQIADAIKATLVGAMTPSLLVRAYGYNELPEGVNDAPSLMVYWQSVVNDKYTDTDRTTFGGVRVKELVFRIDYYQDARNNMEQNNALLTRGADEIIDILEQEALGCTAGGGHCPPFSLCGLKTFRWTGERVTFEYGGVLYYGARFELFLRVF